MNRLPPDLAEVVAELRKGLEELYGARFSGVKEAAIWSMCGDVVTLGYVPAGGPQRRSSANRRRAGISISQVLFGNIVATGARGTHRSSCRRSGSERAEYLPTAPCVEGPTDWS